MRGKTPMNRATFAGFVLLVAATHAIAEKPLADYSFIRGVCYPGSWHNPQAIVERDLGYARRLNPNSTRFWLRYAEYEKRPAEFLAAVENYAQTAHRMGVSSMPIL